MDRPYLKGLPGNTRNISGGVKDYFPRPKNVPQGLDPEERATKFLEINSRNENRWID